MTQGLKLKAYKLDHIGIAVKDLAQAIDNYTGLIHGALSHEETIDSQGVKAAFIKLGKQSIELLQPIHDQSPVAKFISKRGEGVHHVAFKVKDIRKEMTRLREEGYRLINDDPVMGANNKLVCFIHPKEGNGVLIELCQKQNK